MKPVKMNLTACTKKRQTYITSLGAFKSKKEADRYEILLDMQQKGIITNIHRGVSFTLLDAVYNNKTVRKVLKTKINTEKKKVCVEEAVTLETDFVYQNSKDKLRVEMARSAKVYKDPVYIIKRKLMRYLYQIVIIEN